MIHIPSGKWSTGAVMRVIVPVALQLVLFKDVWPVVLIPPVTIVVLTCNQGMFFVLVRPKSWETRIIGMMLGGVAALFAVIANYSWNGFLGQIGVVGAHARGYLENTVASLAVPPGDLVAVLRIFSQHMNEIEGILVDILGVALIWMGGRLDNWCRARWSRSRAARQAEATSLERGTAKAS
jgi:hypothetical protein